MALLVLGTAAAQDLPPVSASHDYARLHDGVVAPQLLHAVDPQYTEQGIQASIEGSVVLEAVISKSGDVAYASVLSPLPAGLDQKALAAVKHWKYTPGTMDNEDIPVLMTIDVLFRLPYKPGNLKMEERRKAFDRVLSRTSGTGSVPTAADVAELKRLAQEDMPAAVGLLGEWTLIGKGVPRNKAEGIQEVQRAAAADDPESLFVIGTWEREGKLVAGNEAQGWTDIDKAAFLGNAEAQMALGEKSSQAQHSQQSEEAFRMCAATAHAACEYQLGRLLISGAGLTPNRFAQGVTWLALAKDHGDAAAAALWQSASAKLSSVQWEWVEKLKPHLELKHYHGF